MPRLLLVDDNPSIHRIAESLLAPTDVELVCVDSAAEALDRIGKGERYDVALVDTAMPGMDGWTLLTRLRAMEETALMPIALMAGVLDPVDPAKLAKAPIQGFLKKPIELRELGDRVKTLLVTPVERVSAPSPFTTVPATPAKDLVRMAEPSLPEFRPDFEQIEAPGAASPALPAGEDDLLVLTAEDLWPGEAAPEPEFPVEDLLASAPEPEAVEWVEPTPVPAPEPAAADPVTPAAAPDPLGEEIPEIHLELEELDLESLQDLTGEASPEAPAPAAPAPSLAPEVDEEELTTLSGLETLDDLPALPAEEAEPSSSHLAEAANAAGLAAAAAAILGEGPESFGGGPEARPAVFPSEPPATAAAGPESFTMSGLEEPEFDEPDFDEPLFDAPLKVEPRAAAASELLEEELEIPVFPEPTVSAVTGQPPAAPGQPGPIHPDQAQALVQALLADPVLVDALVKAVVARMGDQVIREIAWEVIPDLAGRLQR